MFDVQKYHQARLSYFDACCGGRVVWHQIASNDQGCCSLAVADQAWSQIEEHAPEPGAIADTTLSGLEFAGATPVMAPKAVLGIRMVFAAWLGEGHEAVKELAVAAEVMRVRKELNRYKAAAGDEPADNAIVFVELQTAILPVIANRMTHGASPDPTVWAAD